MIDAPRLPDFDPLDLATAMERRRTPLGEYLGAQAGEMFWQGLPGQAAAEARTGRIIGQLDMPITDPLSGVVMGEPVRPEGAMSQEEWRASPHWREGLQWDAAMTPGRAAAIAGVKDENDYRRWLIQQRQAGIVDGFAGFVAGMAGGALDPSNYIPFAGPAFRAQALARYGGIGGRAAEMALNAGAGVALSQTIVAPSRMGYGDDVTAAGVITDIAMGAALGAALGGAAGIYARLRGERIPSLAEAEAARRQIVQAAADLQAGRPIDVDPRVPSLFRESLLNDTALARGLDEAPAVTFADGELRPFADAPAFAAAHARDRPAGETVPDVRFDMGALDAVTQLHVAHWLPALGDAPAGVTLSARAIKHLFEQRPDIADALLRRLADLVERPSEILPNRNPGRPDSVVFARELRDPNRPELRHDVAVLELAAGKDGLEIVSIHVMPDRTLRKYREETGARAAGTTPDGSKSVHSPDHLGTEVPHPGADFPALRPREGNIGTAVPGRNPAHPPLDLAAPPPAPPRRGRALLPGTGGARPGEGGGANAVRSAAADAAAPRPRTADEAAAQLGLEGDAVAGDVAAFRALDAAGKLTPEERAAMQAADAQALRAEGDAKAIAAALFCSIRGG